MTFLGKIQSSRLPTTNQGAEEVPFQRWFKFKEAFASSLVMSVRDQVNYSGGTILDPFGGSGTTALTSQLLGSNASTIEVNPYLADIIRAKTNTYDLSNLKADQLILFQNINTYNAKFDNYLNSLPPTFIETTKKERWLFNRDIANRISQYFQAIQNVKSPTNKLLFKVLFGSCLVAVSNAYISGKGRRYRKNWQDRKISFKDLDDIFFNKVQMALEDIILYANTRNGKVTLYQGDTRQIIHEIDEKFELVLFSPPYPNSFDYTDVYNIELWILRYLKSSHENKNLRKETLRSHVQIYRDYSFGDIKSPTLENCYNQLVSKRNALWNKNLPEMVCAYFDDLQNIIKGINNCLISNGYIAMVVGDSRYVNVQIPVAKILAEIADIQGFGVIFNEPARSMRTSPQQGGQAELAESLIILKR